MITKSIKVFGLSSLTRAKAIKPRAPFCAVPPRPPAFRMPNICTPSLQAAYVAGFILLILKECLSSRSLSEGGRWPSAQGHARVAQAERRRRAAAPTMVVLACGRCGGVKRRSASEDKTTESDEKTMQPPATNGGRRSRAAG